MTTLVNHRSYVSLVLALKRHVSSYLRKRAIICTIPSIYNQYFNAVSVVILILYSYCVVNLMFTFYKRSPWLLWPREESRST